MQQKPKKALRGLFTRTEPSLAAMAVEEPLTTEAAPVSPSLPIEVSNDESATLLEATKAVDAIPEVKSPQPSHLAVLADSGCDVTSPEARQTERELSAAGALGAVVRGFTATVVERNSWEEYDYLDCIRRIDQAQTEAFLLKGKLLEEVKRRFFLDNKQGWKNFCDNRLDMNYTTANQYIRVAEEFDALARQRPEFGFEHFKALLPLPPEQRSEILEGHKTLTVKAIRKLVQEKLTPELLGASAHPGDAKILVRTLEQLKEQIVSGNFALLPQLQRWQLAAACQNLSEELGVLSSQLNARSLEAKERPGASVGAVAHRISDTSF
ncbi:MAG: hypothetical protein IOD12_10745 [Silvanigrellales bacterium]|nr:hypothetical protein [Silvanigrellales bacterium]